MAENDPLPYPRSFFAALRVNSLFRVAAVAALLSPVPNAAPRAADVVCAGTSASGLICLDQGGFRQFTRRAGDLPDDRIADLAVCDEKVVFASGEFVQSFDGVEFGALNKPGRGLVQRIACDEEGRLWAATETALSQWDGKAWRHFDLREIAPQGARRLQVAAIAAGSEGSAWLTMPDGVVAHYDGARWTSHRQGHGFRERHQFGRLIVDRHDRVWIPYARGLYTFRDERWESVPAIPSAHFIAEDAKGRLWLSSGLRVAMIQGSDRREFDAEQNVRALAVDGADAVWAATEFGLARYDGKRWEARQMHNSLIADNDLMSIGTLGKGLRMPAPQLMPRGSLQGKIIWSDGQPIADGDVQLCGLRAYDHGSQAGPCDDKPLAVRAKTSATGAFAFRDLFAANYYLVLRPKGQRRWIRFATDAERLKVLPGRDHEVGAILIDTRQRTN